jgi:hypothetical protein
MQREGKQMPWQQLSLGKSLGTKPLMHISVLHFHFEWLIE